MTRVLDGHAIAGRIREDLRGCVETLEAAGVRPGLATVLMSDDPAAETHARMKVRACDDLGIEGRLRSVDPDAPTDDLLAVLDGLADDPAVHGVFVQLPLPEGVDRGRIVERIPPGKDVDALHPENVGRLVAGDPRFVPVTPLAIRRLLSVVDVDPAGMDAVVVGRSSFVGTPMANLLLQKAEGGNATVTVCHSRTVDLAEKTREADLLIAARGVPELVDGSMLSDGVVVVDAGGRRVEADTEKGYEVVGDVHFESARERASVIVPAPGGVGPVTIEMLLSNTLLAASRQTGVGIDLP